MVDINLLPWREKQTRYEKQVFLFMLSAAIVGALMIVLSVDRYFAGRQQSVQEYIEQLKKELIWREGLAHQTSQQFISAPQENILDFFQRLNEANTRAVCFEQIKKSKAGIEFIGFASSPQHLTSFLQTATMATYFSELKVNKLEQQNGQLKFYLVGKNNVV